MGYYYLDTCVDDFNEDEALKWFLKAIEQGCEESELYFYLGYSYYIRNDDSEAIKWYLKSAEKGNVDAEKELGDIFYFCTGNSDEACKWYKRAFEHGRTSGLRNLGDIYSKRYKDGGRNEQDYNEAMKWYIKDAAYHIDESITQERIQELIDEKYKDNIL